MAAEWKHSVVFSVSHELCTGLGTLSWLSQDSREFKTKMSLGVLFALRVLVENKLNMGLWAGKKKLRTIAPSGQSASIK